MQMKPIAAGIASLGRGNDKMLVHMTPGEVAGLQAIAMKHGGSLTINPHTGLPEAGFLSSILPTLAGAALMATPLGPAIGPWGIAALTGGLSALSSGSLSKGLMAGLGAFGGAGLGGALQGLAPEAQAMAANSLGSERILGDFGELGYGGPAAAISPPTAAYPAGYDPVSAAYGPFSGPASGAAQSQMPPAVMGEAMYRPSMQGVAQVTSSVPLSPWEKLGSGAKYAFENPSSVLTRDNGKLGLMAAAPLLSYGATQLAQQPTLRGGVASLGQSSVPSGREQYKYSRYYNPETGRFEGPGYEYLGRYAEGGSIPPMDGAYPQANLTRSTYANSTQTPLSSEVVGGYGPAINPFTGEQRMASGGIAETYGTPYQYTAPDTRPLKNVTDSQLSLLAEEADDAATQAAAVNELYKRNPGRRPAKSSFTKMAAGGIAGVHEYAAGGRLLDGPGDGMSDDIPAVIKGPKPQRAALADGEFVVPADVVSHLGNGSTKAGAKRLYAMMDRVRMARTRRKKQSPQINADRYLPA